jgi:hypothetical protein
MNQFEYNGEIYNDDRLYVLYVCKCTVEVSDGIITTTIYHESAPDDHKWCLVTYRNVKRYIACRVDHFDSENEALAYSREVEPTVPLISLGGSSPRIPLPYDQFVHWKERNNFKDYDYKTMYLPGGTNPRETIIIKQH